MRRHEMGPYYRDLVLGAVAVEPEPLPTSSRSTEGAKGRNDSRYLIFRFRVFCMEGARVAQDRAVAQGPRPELHAPLEPADDIFRRRRLGRARTPGPRPGSRRQRRRPLGARPAGACAHAAPEQFPKILRKLF